MEQLEEQIDIQKAPCTECVSSIREIQSLIVQYGMNSTVVLSHVMELVSGMVYLRRDDGQFLMANHHTGYFYGQSVKDLLQTPGADTMALCDGAPQMWKADEEVIRTGKLKHLEERVRNAAGQEFFYSTIKIPHYLQAGVHFADLKDGVVTENLVTEGTKVDAVLSLSVDVTDLTLATRQIQNQYNFDPLTGLANRNLLRRRTKQAMAHCKRTSCIGALLCIDLDNFREINEIFGHVSGDLLLKQVAEALSARVENPDYLLARFSGNHFALLMKEAASREDVFELADGLIEDFAEPFIFDERRIAVKVSIGVSFFPDQADCFEALLKNTELASSLAKREGGGRWSVFSPELSDSVQRRHHIANQLRYGIEADQFTLSYQPIISRETGAVVGMEALVRWNQQHLLFVHPSEFIPIAEQTGLIIPIGEWVIKRALFEQKRWLEENPGTSLAVNLSSVQFQQPEFGQKLAAIVSESGIDPRCLELEITESTIMKDIKSAIKTMHGFHEMGLGISIDDFGTGYSSLSYLKRFPINKIKIDRSFVQDMGQDSD
ncbi:MAG: EAL domain-containing protein, partial [Gammaproteobacteria bacterium]